MQNNSKFYKIIKGIMEQRDPKKCKTEIFNIVTQTLIKRNRSKIQAMDMKSLNVSKYDVFNNLAQLSTPGILQYSMEI
jgi:hypothetical protein